METETETTASSAPHEESLYDQIDRYPWDADAEFQSGLTAILGAQSDPEQVADLTLRARCFYYSRKFNTNADFDAYKAYLAQVNGPSQNGGSGLPGTTAASEQQQVQSVPSTSDASQQPQQAPYPTSFAEIVELIQSGKPIPGIKEIPPTVLEGQGTAPAQARRKKPWEKDEAPSEPVS